MTKNGENAWVSFEDDDGEPRAFWQAEQCPAEKCSASAWKRACCWSYQSHEQCLQYVLYHLTASSLHESLSEDERLDTLLRTVVLEKEETFQERDSYRKEVLKDAEKEEKAKKKREAAAMSGGQDDVHVRNVVRAPAKGSGKKLPIGAPAPPPGPPPGYPPSDDTLGAGASAVLAKVADAVNNLAAATAATATASPLPPATKATPMPALRRSIADSGGASSSGINVGPLLLYGGDTTRVPNSSLRIIGESLDRARASCEQMHSVCAGMAQGFSSEAQILNAASVVIQDSLRRN